MNDANVRSPRAEGSVTGEGLLCKDSFTKNRAIGTDRPAAATCACQQAKAPSRIRALAIVVADLVPRSSWTGVGLFWLTGISGLYARRSLR